MDQTTPYGYIAKASIPCLISASVVLGQITLGDIGSGGDYTSEYFKARKAGLIFEHRAADVDAAAIVALPSAADDLKYIKSVLKLTITDLADCMGVARPTIYSWLSGTRIKLENAQRLSNLRGAADVLGLVGPISPLQMDRKLGDGKTLLEIIRGGGDGRKAAKSLLSILQREAEQGHMLDVLLADSEVTASKKSDYGVPALDERG